MKRIKNIEAIIRRCEKLEELGFKIQHEDSHVKIIDDPFHPLYDLDADFSASDENKFIKRAIVSAYEYGVSMGIKQQQEKLRDLLGMNEE